MGFVGLNSSWGAGMHVPLMPVELHCDRVLGKPCLPIVPSDARVEKEDAMPSLGWHPIWQASQGGKCQVFRFGHHVCTLSQVMVDGRRRVQCKVWVGIQFGKDHKGENTKCFGSGIMFAHCHK